MDDGDRHGEDLLHANPAEERLLPQRAYQQRLARGLLRAIEDYFAAHAVR